jgi:hypothetical protein
VVWAVIEEWPSPDTLFGAVAIAVTAVAMLDLVVMPGKPGVNRFGANPVEARQRSGPTTT